MAFCPNCGTDVQGKFCAKCGSPVPEAPGGGGYAPPQGGYAPPPGGGSYAPPQGGYAPPQAAPAAQGLETNMASALCYLFGWITGVIFLVLAPYNTNPTVRFHAFQSIFFNVALIPFYFVLFIVGMILSFIPGLRHIMIAIYPLVGLCIFGLWLFLIFKAYNKEKFLLPIIGPLAEKQAGA